MKRKTIINTIAIALALLFIYASVDKLLNISAFRLQLDKSPLMGAFAKQVSWLLPVLQLCIGCLLLWRSTRLAGLFCSFFLIGVFTIYMVSMINTADNQPCGCGELWQRLSVERHIIFNLGAVLVCGVAIILSGRLGRKFDTFSHS